MYNKKHTSSRQYHQHIEKEAYKKQNIKILIKKYHVTTQTAYHITQLALSENVSEGRIIDKLMRNYLAERCEL